MSISIVSAAYDREDNDNSLAENSINPTTPTTDLGEASNTSDFSSKQESLTGMNDDSSRLNAYHPEEHTPIIPEDSDQNPVIVKKDDTILLTNDADTIFSSPEETIKSEQAIDIPNMYIQADTHTENIEKPGKQEQDIIGFDMDELLTVKETSLSNPTTIDEDKKTVDMMQTPKTGDIFNSPAVQATIDSPIDTKQIHNNDPKNSIAKQGSLIKGIGVIVSGCAAILILWFVTKTMFPLGFNNTNSDGVKFDSTLIVGEDVVQEELPKHSADTRTEQEIIREELQEYTSLGTSYYQLGRDLKDRNMVRYALYVEKKSQDLIDLLASDPNMDTKDIVVYFAQFDDYLRTLKEWQENLGLELPTNNQPLPPTPNIDTTQENIIDDLEMNTDILDSEDIGSAGDIRGFNTLFPSESNDTNSRSGFEQAKPEQSELSDG